MYQGSDINYEIANTIEASFSKDNSGALHTIDNAHHEIHEGDYWFGDDISASLSSSAIKYWLFVTPDEATCFHSFPSISGTGEFELIAYEGVTVASNGTEIPMLNRNRVSNSASTTTYKFYKDATSPTITNCPIVRYVRVGSGKNAVGDSRTESELILKPNTKYLIKVTASTNGTYISCHMNGYITPIY